MFLSSGTPEQEIALLATMQDALRERGWIDGQNLFIERRYAHGKYERAPDLISDLLRLNPDLLMTRGGPVTTAAKRATATVPIVMWGITDPVGIGVVASIARPGGNITGLSDDQGPDIVGKRLELLKGMVPRASRVAVLYNPADRSNVLVLKQLQDAAPALHLTLQHSRCKHRETSRAPSA